MVLVRKTQANLYLIENSIFGVRSKNGRISLEGARLQAYNKSDGSQDGLFVRSSPPLGFSPALTPPAPVSQESEAGVPADSAPLAREMLCSLLAPNTDSAGNRSDREGDNGRGF